MLSRCQRSVGNIFLALQMLRVSDLHAVTVVLAISVRVVALLVTCETTCAKSESQLCRATSNRSARFRGSGTNIRRRRSRACGVTYSGNVSGVVVIYLYSRLILSPSGFAGSSSNGR